MTSPDAYEETWMVDGDPVSMGPATALRYFADGWKFVTPSSVRAEGERVPQEEFDERVALRDSVRAVSKASEAKAKP